MPRTYLLAEFRELTGLCTKTVYRYIKKGWVDEPDRDFRGRFLFEDKHLRQVAAARRNKGRTDIPVCHKETTE